MKTEHFLLGMKVKSKGFEEIIFLLHLQRVQTAICFFSVWPEVDILNREGSTLGTSNYLPGKPEQDTEGSTINDLGGLRKIRK